MEIASGLLSSACQLACGPVCQQLNYIRKLRENEEAMQSEWRTLSSQKNDICTNMNTGQVQYGKTSTEAVKDWLKKVEEIEKRVNSLGSGGAHHMCCKGFCPNYYSRLKRSKKTMGILREVEDLQEKGKPFAEGENLFIDSLPGTSSSLPGTTLHGTSAERKKEEILQCIMDPEVGKIGVYGMGGVGKTTIMRQIYNQLKEKKDDFDIVIWVTVSSVFELAKLQGTIAEQLGCPLSSDETSRAMELSEALRRRRNFVIILDDIWDGVSLQSVGIPEDGNGSKIVWTTRSRAVCHKMESDGEIGVESLTPEEAWSLFKEKVGGEDIISPEIKPIAEQVAMECGGLPLALITVGRALRKENQLRVWMYALQQLKKSRADQIHGMGEEVFGSLKFSYKRLSSDEIRACFLYCALYPEDSEILVDELIEYWMAEGLIDEEGSMQAEKDKGHAYLKELKDACMIESVGDDDDYVRMHDLIRDLAINITKEQFMVKAGLWLKESPKEEEWVESLERVSLMGNLIEAFQGQPNCPQLSTLLLHNGNWERVTFSDTFFNHMHNLKVYKVHNVNNESMEKVILPVTANTMEIRDCNFIRLSDSFATDDLRYCQINECEEMKWIGKEGEIVFPSLETLRLLNLHHFEGLCKEKTHEETLKNLRRLHIFLCHKLKYLIPYDLLVNNLQNLEEILIGYCDEMEDIISGMASATIASLPKLKKLTLWKLPALTSIYQGKLVCDSLCQIKIQDCPKLKNLPFLMNNVPLVGISIIVSEEWWKAVEWADPQLKELFQPSFGIIDDLTKAKRS